MSAPLLAELVIGLIPSQSATFEKHLQKEPPATLFHYTRQEGLLGIIGSMKLHATKVQYMNDSSEFSLALDVAKARIDARLASTSDAAEQKKLKSLLTSDRRPIARVNIFAACFCKDGDYLGQWRGYTSGGPGFALGLSTASLKKATGGKHFRLGQCIYDPADQSKILDEILDHCLGLESDACAAELERRICSVGAFFKDKAFEDEDEWRLVSPVTPIDVDEVGFRPGRSLIVPYLAVPLDLAVQGTVQKIVVGPCPHSIASVSSIRMLLRHYRIWAVQEPGAVLETPEVASSNIPYRDW